MGDLVNLRQVRKQRARDDASKQAETNRARFGRTKDERKRDELNAQRAQSAVDQHRLDSETPAS